MFAYGQAVVETESVVDEVGAVDFDEEGRLGADSLTHSGADFPQQAGSVFETAAVFVGAAVVIGGQKLAQQKAGGGMDFHPVKAGRDRSLRGGNKRSFQLLDVFRGHGFASAFGQFVGNTGRAVYIGHVDKSLRPAENELQDDFAALLVHLVGKSLVVVQQPIVMEAQHAGQTPAGGQDRRGAGDDQADLRGRQIRVQVRQRRRNLAVRAGHAFIGGAADNMVGQG